MALSLTVCKQLSREASIMWSGRNNPVDTRCFAHVDQVLCDKSPGTPPLQLRHVTRA